MISNLCQGVTHFWHDRNCKVASHFSQSELPALCYSKQGYTALSKWGAEAGVINNNLTITLLLVYSIREAKASHPAECDDNPNHYQSHPWLYSGHPDAVISIGLSILKTRLHHVKLSFWAKGRYMSFAHFLWPWLPWIAKTQYNASWYSMSRLITGLIVDNFLHPQVQWLDTIQEYEPMY